ncbi:MAG: uncharacterized protein KVP18_001636 [Porospora cf. gigantea A]|nr:MAG: hypothetical protein KVP18_001636 [Porospora cf. gigantea A]
MHVCVFAPDDPRLAEFLCLVYLVLFDTLSGDQALAAMSPSLLEVDEIDEVLLDFLNHLHEHRAHFRKQTFTKIIEYADHGFGPVVLPSATSISSSSERTLGDLIKVTARETACSQSSTPVRSETGRESFVSSVSETAKASRRVAVSIRNPATSQKSRRSEILHSTSRQAPSDVSHAPSVAYRVEVSQTRPQTTTDDRPAYPGVPTTYAPVSYIAALQDPAVVHSTSSQWDITRSCDDSVKESAESQDAWVNYCRVASYHEQYQRLAENHMQSLRPKSHGKSSSRRTRSRRPSQSMASQRTTLTRGARSRRRSVDTEDTFMQFHGRPRPEARMHSEWARVSSVADDASFTDNWESVSVRGAVKYQGPKKQPGCQGIGKKIQQGCLGLW